MGGVKCKLLPLNCKKLKKLISMKISGYHSRPSYSEELIVLAMLFIRNIRFTYCYDGFSIIMCYKYFKTK
jgi:hypothetical protein